MRCKGRQNQTRPSPPAPVQMPNLLFLPAMRFGLLLLLVLLSACSGDKDKSTKKVFHYNEATGIASLDPAFANDQAKIWACNHLYNGLVKLDDSLHVKPCIAWRWVISPDGKTYTFYLRQDVRFHEDPLLTDER